MLKKILFIVSLSLLNISTLYADNNVTEKELLTALNGGVNTTQKFLKKVPTYQLYEYDQTILHYAVSLNKYDIVDFLVSKDVELSRKGGIYYGTALQDAIFYGYLRIARLLIQSGTELNLKNIDGETALHIAAKNAYIDIVELLLANGASKNVYNAENQTPYALIPSFTRESTQKLKSLLKPEVDSEVNTKRQEISGTTFILDNTDFNGAEFTLDKMNFNTTEDHLNHEVNIVPPRSQSKSFQMDVVSESSKIDNSNIGTRINSN